MMNAPTKKRKIINEDTSSKNDGMEFSNHNDSNTSSFIQSGTNDDEEDWKRAVLNLNELLLWIDRALDDEQTSFELEIPNENYYYQLNNNENDQDVRNFMRKDHDDTILKNFFQDGEAILKTIQQHEKLRQKKLSEIVFRVLIPILSSPIVLDANIHSGIIIPFSEHDFQSEPLMSPWLHLSRERLIIFLSQKCLFSLWKLETSETTKQFMIQTVMKDISENLQPKILEIYSKLDPNTEPLLFLRNCIKCIRKDNLTEEFISTIFKLFSKFIELTCLHIGDQDLPFTLLFIMNDLLYNYLKFWIAQNHTSGEDFRCISSISNFVKLQLTKYDTMDVNCKKLFSIMRTIINIQNCIQMVPTLLETCSFILENYLRRIILVDPNSSQTLVSETMDFIVAREYFLLALRTFEICSSDESARKLVESFISRNEQIMSRLLNTCSVSDFYSYIYAIGVSHDVQLLIIFNSLLDIFKVWSSKYDNQSSNEVLQQFIQEKLHPLEVMFQFIGILSFKINVMMDYLISDETCENALKLLFKFSKWTKMNDSKKKVDSNPPCTQNAVKEKLTIISQFLQELNEQIFSLEQKNLFPYSTQVLQERLKATIESLSRIKNHLY
nr:unnamed protein product [Naegleria fowleri]